MANAVGGISARACDSCLKKRARWYCAADDAFLCQCCDASVHSANSLARRHQRVRLKSIRLNSDHESGPGRCQISAQSWHQGFTRKARTPRQKKIARLCSDDDPVVSGSSNPSPLVPEISSEGCARRENDELDLVLHRVPVFDSQIDTEIGGELGHVSDEFSLEEMDLSEFAADFESFLGKGIEDAAWFDMEGLEIERAVKIEDASLPTHVEFTHLNFGYDNGEEHTKKDAQDDHVYQKKIFLNLDYDGVMSAWDGQKSPWTTGERPDLNSSGECWPYCLGMCGTIHGMDGDTAGVMSRSTVDGGRMARVMKYREKRRTRLFSKKIRYQVRKLNAEKRPRIKGRFVKTPNFVLKS